MSRIVIMSARMGAGHDGAARALARRYHDRGMAVDIVDVLDMLPGPLGRLLCDGYRRQLTMAPRTWDWLLAELDRPVPAAAARWFARLAGRRLAEVLDASVALVVSTYPLATHAVAASRHGAGSPPRSSSTSPTRPCIGCVSARART